MSNTEKNADYLQGLLNSLQHGVTKAQNGSLTEDNYIVEELEKFAFAMGFDLTDLKPFDS